MAASVHDQSHLAGLFDAGEITRLFSATAEIRAMLLVEGALAKVQAAAGVIPEISGAAIHRASLELQIDPAGLAAATARNGVSVPALIAAFQSAMQAPEHAQYLHWGATSQDIIDSALMLRLRQAVSLIGATLDAALQAMADLADTHADTPLAARTYGQQAAPTGFGAVVASWGWPLLQARRDLAKCDFPVSLSGAVGTGTALGSDPPAIRAALADALNLSDPQRSWHTDRSPVLSIANALISATTALGKMAEDIIAMVQSELGELSLPGTGESSTMPQKQNPVAPSVICALARVLPALQTSLNSAAMHRFQRDGAAWFTEWMVLPQIVLGAASAAQHGQKIAEGLIVNSHAMAQVFENDGLLFAESLSFALTAQMSRSDAKLAIKELFAQARDTGTPLPDLARARWPDLPADLFSAKAALGTAPDEARRFAAEIRKV